MSVSAEAGFNAVHLTNLSASAVAGLVVATQAQMETGTSVKEVVTPGRQQYHPGSAKVWAVFNGTATSVTAGAAFNVTSITRNAQGTYTIAYTTPFSGNAYAAVATCEPIPNTRAVNVRSSSAANATLIVTDIVGQSLQDANVISFVAYGDQ